MDRKGMDAFKRSHLAALDMISSARNDAAKQNTASSSEPKPKKPKTTTHGTKPSGAHKHRPKHHYELERQMGNRFPILTKVIKYLKQRFHEGLLEPLNIEDLLEEARMADTPPLIKGWLANDALPNNPKVEMVQKGGHRCFIFHPRFPKVRDRHSLLNLLESFAAEGEGGVLLEDLLESAPNAVKLVNSLVENGDAIAIPLVNQRRLNAATKDSGEGGASSSMPAPTSRQTNLVVFSSQRQYGLQGVDDKLIAMWRAIEPGGAEIASALAGEPLPDKSKMKGKRGRPKTSKDGIPSFKQTNVHLANAGVLINFQKG